MSNKSTFLFYNHDITDRFSELIDDEQLQDIANYGCASCAPSGLIYYHELVQVFDELEDSIEDVCYDVLGIDWLQQLSQDVSSVNELKGKCVWFAVENFAAAKFAYLENIAMEVA